MYWAVGCVGGGMYVQRASREIGDVTQTYLCVINFCLGRPPGNRRRQSSRPQHPPQLKFHHGHRAKIRNRVTAKTNFGWGLRVL